MQAIELLAPSKNLESGKAAINYGADAVYIGADRFGARAAAANPVGDIAELVQYAHKYNAKVFVTLNTILYDDELEEAEKLIHQLYNAGADALIIQDMGILQMDLPPIALHASTQTNNYDPERIRFLDQMGFKRIVLARELALDEIRDIRKQIKAELEFFVHGALCVSLSGQCYFSQAITGRSANRGMCAQMCRHPYNLLDAQGNKLVTNSHLLSLKDLNLNNSLKELIKAGITSLKIEGRLKDINYVKNVVSYYRKKLDELFALGPGYQKASSGTTTICFEPDPERSFNRQCTSYFLLGRYKNLVNQASPKSMGRYIGPIDRIEKNFITIKTNEPLHNGDGLCFIKNNELVGIRANKVVENKVFVNNVAELSQGTELYRNYDHEFNKQLEADRSLRKVSAVISISEKQNQLVFGILDEDELSSTFIIDQLPEAAQNAERADQNLISQLSKSGDSIFDINKVDNNCQTAWFFPISQLDEIRRTLFSKHENYRVQVFARKDAPLKTENAAYHKLQVDFTENISNQKAIEFYNEHGVKSMEQALEISETKNDQLLMTTRYCIKYELGYCRRFQKTKDTPAEPLYLEDKNRKYLLEFDCANCLMKIRLASKN